MKLSNTTRIVQRCFMACSPVNVPVLLLAVLAMTSTPVHAETQRRPNVILIMADDLGFETLGCNGGTSYRTPNLDTLARNGARFTHCYANPLCTPTRVTLMTGRYNYRNYTAFAQLPPDEPTFGHMMQDAGYVTAVVGKWQLQNRTPLDAGFDEFLLKIDSNRDGYADPIVYSSLDPEPKKRLGQYGPDVFWEYISNFLERHRDRPFFLYYPMHLTHFYFSPTPESLEWKSGDRHLTAEHHLRPDSLNTRFFTDMVAYMDKNVGRIVEKLQAMGLRENTLLLFLGDNGTEVSIRSMMGDREIAGEKGALTRAGIHVPMIVNWPGRIDAGRVVHSPVVTADVLATMAEATGARPQRPSGDGMLDGISFMPSLTGQPGNLREWALVEYVLENRGTMYLGHEGRCVLDGRWKLYDSGVSRRGQRYYRAGQLFDLHNDPGETSPIAPGRDSLESSQARRRARAFLDLHPVPNRLTSTGNDESVVGTKPNIVFILTDDQGYGDLGCYGSTTIATPRIDALAEQGMKFDSFYVHNRCSPTRLALMTGCHAHRAGCAKVIYRRDRMGIHPAEITVAELLKQAGYASDNGPQLNVEGHGSAGVLRDGKWTDFEGGIRVPCIMRWPGVIPAGSLNREITGIIDFLPTFCALAGVDVPTDRIIDGRNLLPYMQGQEVRPTPPIHDTFIVPGATIRYKHWKLLIKGQKPGGGKSDQQGRTDRVPAPAGSLFNLKTDPGETTDVSSQHPEIVKDLTQRMETAMAELKANTRAIGNIAE